MLLFIFIGILVAILGWWTIVHELRMAFNKVEYVRGKLRSKTRGHHDDESANLKTNAQLENLAFCKYYYRDGYGIETSWKKARYYVETLGFVPCIPLTAYYKTPYDETQDISYDRVKTDFYFNRRFLDQFDSLIVTTRIRIIDRETSNKTERKLMFKTITKDTTVKFKDGSVSSNRFTYFDPPEDLIYDTGWPGTKEWGKTKYYIQFFDKMGIYLDVMAWDIFDDLGWKIRRDAEWAAKRISNNDEIVFKD